MLKLQADIINKIRSGYRPLQPVARGSSNPLPDFRVTLPPPDRSMAGSVLPDSAPCLRDAGAPPQRDASPAASSELSADSSDSDCSAASASDPDLAPEPKAARTGPSGPPLVTHIFTIHAAMSCTVRLPVPPILTGLFVFSLLALSPFGSGRPAVLLWDTWCPVPPAGAPTLPSPRLPRMSLQLLCLP